MNYARFVDGKPVEILRPVFYSEGAQILDPATGDLVDVGGQQVPPEALYPPDWLDVLQPFEGDELPPEPVPAPTADEIRARRDQLLAASDWSQMRDVPEATASKWAPYRQALRDISQQEGFPDDVKWPTPPQ